MSSKSLTASDIGAACVCLAVRKTARLVARRYDDAMRPLGITSGQFSVLAALLRDGAVPLGALAEQLGMDRTTLNRNLKPLELQKLVETTHDEADARVRGLVLSNKGRILVERAIPIWTGVQAESHHRLGQNWPEFRAQLQSLT